MLPGTMAAVPGSATPARPLPAAATRFGTPVYVLDMADVAAAAARLEAAFGPPWHRLYSLKANDLPAITSFLHSHGWGASVVSAGEWRHARGGGVANESVAFEGLGKTDAQLELWSARPPRAARCAGSRSSPGRRPRCWPGLPGAAGLGRRRPAAAGPPAPPQPRGHAGDPAGVRGRRAGEQVRHELSGDPGARAKRRAGRARATTARDPRARGVGPDRRPGVLPRRGQRGAGCSRPCGPSAGPQRPLAGWTRSTSAAGFRCPAAARPGPEAFRDALVAALHEAKP